MKVFLILLTFIFLTTCAWAKKVNFAMSSSGGVSLGNYQAGRLYYQNQIIHENQDLVFPTVFTGASAGSINSLLSLIGLCSKREESPSQSLYWNLWKKISFDKLVMGTNKVNSALFSDQVLQESAETIRSEWEKGLEKGCVAYLGIPITLKNPDVIEVTPSLHVQRQLVTIILKITGQGMGQSPLVENLVDTTSTLPTSRIYLGNNPKEYFDSLLNLLLASAAFPGAFPSQEVRVCLTSGKNCDLENSKELEFIDGGMYENQPIKLGYEIKKILHRVDPLHEPAHFRHVDANGKGYTEEESLPKDQDTFLKTMSKTMGNFVATSRNLELYSFIQQNPQAINQITSTISLIPKASEPWGAFMGFFDIGFREFDFLLGMYDSYHEFLNFKKIPLKKKLAKQLEKNSEITELASWRRFSCLKQYLDEEESKWDKICFDPAINNLMALTQVSLLRLYNVCKSPHGERGPACDRFKSQSSMPVLTTGYQNKIFLPKSDQNSGDFMIQSLKNLDYQFDPEEFEKGHPIDQQLRLKFQVMLNSLVERQESKAQKPLQSIGTSVLDAFSYLPPERLLYITFGEVSEVGWMSRKLPWQDKYSRNYLQIALEFVKGSDIFSSNSDQLSVAPIIGITHPLSSSGVAFQYQVGLGLGYIQPMKSLTETRNCSPLQKVCDGLMLRPYIGLSILKNFQINLFGRMGEDEENKIKTDINLAAGLNFFY